MYCQNTPVRFLFPTLDQHSCNHKENVSISVHPRSIKTDLLRHLKVCKYFKRVKKYHILHILIPLTDYTLGCHPTHVHPLGNVYWHITSRSRVERQGNKIECSTYSSDAFSFPTCYTTSFRGHVLEKPPLLQMTQRNLPNCGFG